MHVHLDVIGGISGDMFCAALLDAFPDLQAPLADFIHELTFSTPYKIACVAAKQREISGKRFLVMKNNAVVDDKNHIIFTPLTSPATSVVKPQQVDHAHYSWTSIQAKIARIADTDIRDAVLHIYQALVDAESAVHGVDQQNIHLHEVGAEDALIDMASAAFLVLRSQVRSWSFSPLPWGNGMIKCAHGLLPVPAPATVKILKNFAWKQDDEMGERITPTGAAILAWLAQWKTAGPRGQLLADGYGCGKRQFANTPNILRACVFQQEAAGSETADNVEIVQFDIDDMTPEMLAIAQQRLREQDAVLDLSSYTISGKKGRVMVRTELLCQPQALASLCHAVFTLTTTLGVRHWPCGRQKLARQHAHTFWQEQNWPVKIATRPDHTLTAKLEADAIASVTGSYRQLAELKFFVEQQAVDDVTVQKEEK